MFKLETFIFIVFFLLTKIIQTHCKKFQHYRNIEMQTVNVHHNLLALPEVTNINKSLVFIASLFFLCIY